MLYKITDVPFLFSIIIPKKHLLKKITLADFKNYDDVGILGY